MIMMVVAGKFQFFVIVKWKQQTTYLFSWDSLTIYDGASSTSSMMGKYCGDSIPPSHVSSSNKVLLVLINHLSDGINTYGEFQMEYNPTGKQNTSILNNTDYHIDRWRILVTFFTSRNIYSFFLEKW